jgi:hypothetical protein
LDVTAGVSVSTAVGEIERMIVGARKGKRRSGRSGQLVAAFSAAAKQKKTTTRLSIGIEDNHRRMETDRIRRTRSP